MAFQTRTAWGLGVTDAESWLERAQCRGLADPEMMWPLAGTEYGVEAAVEVCFGCPVRVECLKQGAELREFESVRGGLTGPEREGFHRRGLKVEEYPGHGFVMQECSRCKRGFHRDSRYPWRRVCEGCRPAVYARLPDTVAQYRRLRAAGVGRATIAARLGYKATHGLMTALGRARRLGLIAEDEL